MTCRYEAAERSRRQVLDYLNRNPGSTMRSIADYMGWTRGRTHQFLMRMEDRGEARRKRGEAKQDGQECLAWYAQKSTTVAASDVKQTLTRNLSGAVHSARHEQTPVMRVFGGLGA